MTIYEYIKQYGDKTFEEKEFNEIDNILFSTIIYLDFSNITEEENTLEKIGQIIIKNTKESYLKEELECLKQMIKQNRYKNVQVENYMYIGDKKEQFGAITFKVNKKLKYISFEGTDTLISGWKEDFQLAYMYKTQSQLHAIQYLKKSIKLFGPKIIVGGHSKGGNLALVSAMEQNIIKQLKIKKIYNNDGPGLRLKQFKSLKHRIIQKKYTHIVPHNSIVGMLLRNNNYKIVKSNKKAPFSHYPITWMIEEDRLKETNLNSKSKELELSIIEWLNNHNDEQRKIMIENVFKIFDKCNITNTQELKKIKSIIKIIKELKNIDKETKDLVISFISYNFI